jgi:hypothetical protein
MTDLASKINAYLTPARRQALYRLLLIVGVLIAAVSPAFSTQVAQWTAVITAAGTVASLILAAIVTRAPQWPVIYSAMAALVGALVGTSIITASQADLALRIVSAVITTAPLLVILARTDTRTIDGSPVAEVVLTDLPVASVTPVEVQPVTSISTVQYEDGKIETRYSDGTITTKPGIGNPPTASLS